MSAPAGPRLAILISGRGSNMIAIVRACQSGTLRAQPDIVISDRADATGLESARALGVETAVLPSAPGAAAFERALEAALAGREPQLIALAGFMRIVPASLVSRYLGRMLNVHPSLLPAYPGLDTHRRVLAAGEREHGASVHFVTAQLDSGPVVLQSKVAVEPGDTAATLAARVLTTEHIIYPRALGWCAERRLTWHDDGAWLDGHRLESPVVEDFRAAARSAGEKGN
jgi:phosphoribosylglycinamide formyltransferase 1